MTTKHECRVCGNEKHNDVFQAKESFFGFGTKFQYFQCSNCGCLQISEVPVDMGLYYPQNYYSFPSFANSGTLNSLKQAIRASLRRERVKYAVFGCGFAGKLIQLFYPDYFARSISEFSLHKEDRILDVGCGAGFLLYSLRQLGFRNLLGLDEYIESNITYPNGLRILKGSLEQAEGEWDLIMFNHSLEHMPDQERALRQTALLLSPKGTCIVNTPTVSSYAWERYRTSWVQLDAPRHHYLHSLKSMAVLAKKTNLKVNGIQYNSTAFQFWGSEQYLKGCSLISSRYYGNNPLFVATSLFTLRGLSRRAERLNMVNQGDQVAFYLKK